MNWSQSKTDESAVGISSSVASWDAGAPLSAADFSNTVTWPLFTQPIVTAYEKIIYQEILLRHDGQGFDAGAFVKNLEQGGRVEPLDIATLTRVCDALCADTALSLGLNASRRSLISARWREVLRRQAPTAIRDRLIIEVTESASLNEVENKALGEALNALALEGFCFALDDLGEGTASLEEIETWPLRFVKLDYSLTSGLIGRLRQDENTPPPKFSLQSLLDMERAHSWTLIAEGIEDLEGRDLLAAEGIAAFQGFAIERPKPSAY